MDLIYVKRATIYSAMKVESNKIKELESWVKEHRGVIEYFPEEECGTIYSEIILSDGDRSYECSTFYCGDYIICNENSFEVVKEEYFKKNYCVAEQ